PADFAANRLSGAHRADGIRARDPAGRPPDPRTTVERADADCDQLCLRTGDLAPPSAGNHAAAPRSAAEDVPITLSRRAGKGASLWTRIVAADRCAPLPMLSDFAA